MEEDFMEAEYRSTPLDQHAKANGNGECADCRDEAADLAALAKFPVEIRRLTQEVQRQQVVMYFMCGVLIYTVWKVSR